MVSTLNEKVIHQPWVNILLNKVYRYLSSLSPEIMNKVFSLRSNYCNVCSLNVFATNNPRNKFLLKTTVYRANQLWKILTFEVKDCLSPQFCTL